MLTFERRVHYKFDDGMTAQRRIDLYNPDCFVMVLFSVQF